MRVRVAIGVAALVCAAGASGAAAATKPAPPASWPVIQLERSKARSQQASCSAHARTRFRRAQRKVVPVACEQPPRSKVRDTGFMLLIGG
jgi:hypothetical protein